MCHMLFHDRATKMLHCAPPAHLGLKMMRLEAAKGPLTQGEPRIPSGVANWVHRRCSIFLSHVHLVYPWSITKLDYEQ